MLRITGISLPLSYTDGDLRRRAADLLGVAPGAITACELRKRSVDARKKEAVHFIATVDVTVEGEEKLLRRHVKNNKISRVEDSPYILPPSISPPAVPPVEPVEPVEPEPEEEPAPEPLSRTGA